MKEYKRGDWAVFPDFSEYPTKLEESGQYGFISEMSSGNIFSKATQEECEEMCVTYGYFIRDPRDVMGGKSRGWIEVARVRKATKKDLKKILVHCNKQVKNSIKELEIFKAEYKRVFK